MKKGFTLVEMLGVIVILAILFTIINPIVDSVVKSSKKSVAQKSAEGVEKAAYDFYLDASRDLSKPFYGYVCDFQANCKSLVHDGQTPTEGNLYISQDGVVTGRVKFENYQFYICDKTVSEQNDCHYDDYGDIYQINSSGIITGFRKPFGTYSQRILDIIDSSVIIIPTIVGDTLVTGIASAAFKEFNISELVVISKNNINIDSNAFDFTKLKKIYVPEMYLTSYASMFTTFTGKMYKLRNEI